MTETLVATRHPAAAQIRAYRPSDHGFCRRLWGELTDEHRDLYEPGGAERAGADEGGEEPGAAFEEYLTRLDLSGIWVAEDSRDGVVGLVGLILDGECGEVEPVVVTRTRRGEGIGRALLAYVADQARRRGLQQLTIAPMARNVDAIHSLHAAGYDTLSRITLAIDLAPDRRGRGPGAEPEDRGIGVHGLSFRY